MKKYRVTEKHPELKEGLIFVKYGEYEYICGLSYTQNVKMLYSEILECVEKGWIEKIEKKEFAKSDMIDFAN